MTENEIDNEFGVSKPGATNEEWEDAESNSKILNAAKLNELGVRGEIFKGRYVTYKEEPRKAKDGKKFTSKVHVLQDEAGRNVLINSTGHLDYLIRDRGIVTGDTIKIMYFGKDETDRHSFGLLKRKD